MYPHARDRHVFGILVYGPENLTFRLYIATAAAFARSRHFVGTQNGAPNGTLNSIKPNSRLIRRNIGSENVYVIVLQFQ